MTKPSRCRTVSSLLSLALFVYACGNIQAHANDLQDLRKAYMTVDDQLNKASKRQTTRLATIAKTRTKLNSLLRSHQAGIDKITAKQIELAKSWHDLTVKRRLYGDVLAEYSRTRSEILRVPQAYSRERISAVHADYSRHKKIHVALTTRLGKVARQLGEIKDWLAAHPQNSSFIEKRGALELDLAMSQNAWLLDLEEQELSSLPAERNRLLQAYVQLVGRTGPGAVESIRIFNQKGDNLYDAKWSIEVLAATPENQVCGFPAIPGSPGTTEGATDRQATRIKAFDELDNLIKVFSAQEKRHNARLADLRKQQQVYSPVLIKIGNDYATLYLDIGDIKNNELLFNTGADIGVIVLELALTGGAATVMRKGGELAIEKLGRMAVRKIGKRVPDQAVEAGGRQARQTFAQTYATLIETARARRLSIPDGTAPEEATNLLRQRASELFDKISANAVDQWRQKVGVNVIQVGVRRQLNDQLPRSNQPDPYSHLRSGLTELGIDKMVGGLAFTGATSEFLKRGGEIRAGFRKVLGMAKPKSVTNLLPTQPADLLGIAGSVAKVYAASVFAGKISAKEQEALILSAQYQTLYRSYDQLFHEHALEVFQRDEVRAHIRETRKTLAAMKVSSQVHRQLYLQHNRALTSAEQPYRIEIEFSKPLPEPPEVKLADQAVSFSTTAGNAGRKTWIGSFSLQDADNSKSGVKISVSGKDIAGNELDGTPMNVSIPRMEEEGFHFYDPGPDECYTVSLQLPQPITASFEGLTAEHKISGGE